MAIDTTSLFSGGLTALLSGFLIAFLVIGLILYIFLSLALMTIAKKTNTENAWLAFVPIANVYLMTQIAKVSGWYTAGLLLVIIPFIGGLALLGLFIYIWWKIAEARNRPGWLAIFLLIPIANLIMIGMLAWSDN